MFQRKPAKKNNGGASTSHYGDVVNNENGDAGNTEIDGNIETEAAGNNVQSSKPSKKKVTISFHILLHYFVSTF